MIPINELRVDNYVGMGLKIHPDNTMTVLEVGEIMKLYDGMNSDFYHNDDIEPIPMSEKWLKDFNLPSRKIRSITEYNEYSIRNDFEVYCYIDECGNCLFWIEGNFIIKCDSVHMFQNIYNILNPHETLTKQ